MSPTCSIFRIPVYISGFDSSFEDFFGYEDISNDNLYLC